MRCSDELLDRLCHAADPLADRAVAELGDPRQIGGMIPRLVSYPRPASTDLPPAIVHWLDQHAHLPDWADRERLGRASALWIKHGVTMTMILGSASLVETYAAARLAKALSFSSRLTQDTFKRLRETLLWVNLIMLPGGLYEGAEGLQAVYKVRLMHAAVRCLILRTGRWESERLGVPLCQEDMAGTLMTFAYTVPRSLRRLGVALTDREADDYLYFWSVVGAMMGVRPELLPADMAEAEALTAAIFRRQHAPSPEGLTMCQAVLKTYPRLLSRPLADRFFPAFIRYLSGDQLADMLGVPVSPWTGPVRHYRLVGSLFDLGWHAGNVVRYAVRRRRAARAPAYRMDA